SRRRHTRSKRDWSSDVCSSDLEVLIAYLSRSQPAGEVQLGLARVNDVALLGEMAGAGRSEVRHTGHPEELDSGLIVNTAATTIRSEERRVGKESRAREGRDQG